MCGRTRSAAPIRIASSDSFGIRGSKQHELFSTNGSNTTSTDSAEEVVDVDDGDADNGEDSTSPTVSPSPSAMSVGLINGGVQVILECKCESGFNSSQQCGACLLGHRGTDCHMCPGYSEPLCKGEGTCLADGVLLRYGMDR